MDQCQRATLCGTIMEFEVFLMRRIQRRNVLVIGVESLFYTLEEGNGMNCSNSISFYKFNSMLTARHLLVSKASEKLSEGNNQGVIPAYDVLCCDIGT